MSTIEDVSKACGMAKSTVSRVLNSDPNVSAKTRERVTRVMRELNYQPSAMARGLSKQRSGMIGIVVKRIPHLITDAYYGAVIDSIADRAGAENNTLALYFDRIWRDEERTQLVFADGRCDGLIVLMADQDTAMIDALKSKCIPFVTLNSGVRDESVNSIDIDNFDAGYRMANHLIENGHRRIACLHTGIDSFSIERLTGYRKALKEAGISRDESLEVTGFYPPAVSGYERGQQIAKDSSLGVTAIMATTDRLAVDAIRGIKDIGLRVPEDISVVGINDTVDGQQCNPPLTTLSQSLEEIGSEAVRFLLELIEKPGGPPRQILWPTRLIARESVAKRPLVS